MAEIIDFIVWHALISGMGDFMSRRIHAAGIFQRNDGRTGSVLGQTDHVSIQLALLKGGAFIQRVPQCFCAFRVFRYFHQGCDDLLIATGCLADFLFANRTGWTSCRSCCSFIGDFASGTATATGPHLSGTTAAAAATAFSFLRWGTAATAASAAFCSFLCCGTAATTTAAAFCSFLRSGTAATATAAATFCSSLRRRATATIAAANAFTFLRCGTAVAATAAAAATAATAAFFILIAFESLRGLILRFGIQTIFDGMPRIIILWTF